MGTMQWLQTFRRVAVGQAERIHEDAVAGQATAKYRARGVPSDWYVDPADPDAADRYNRNAKDSLQDQATAFLAAHEALLDGGHDQDEDDLDPPMELRTPAPRLPSRCGSDCRSSRTSMTKVNSAGRLMPCAPRPIRKHSSRKRADPRGTPRRCAVHAMCAHSAWNTRWRMTNGLAFGVAFPSVNAGG